MYPSKTLCGMKLQRVDSSLVADISGRIREGLTCGNEHKKGKMVKFTINFDGMYASIGKVHKEEKYASEALALPENVIEHFEQHKGEYQVYLIDRGQSSAEAFVKMKSHNGLLFVGRLLKNRKLEIIRKIDYPFRIFEQGTLILDALVQLYKTENVEGKNGKMQRKPTLVNEKFRVIKFRPKNDKEDILLITNILNHRAETIATMYRRRWDIEVFFRFLKQNVNFSHLMSLNDNGIQVILYMTLIAAMLIMIYKKENELGFKTAKRRIKMELEEMTIAIAVKLSGGDLLKLNLPPPWDIEL